jgi:threonine dehydratase
MTKPRKQLPLSITDILRANRAIHGAVLNTEFVHSRTLSAITGAEIWLKYENRQFTASFKERGALNRLLHLDEEQKRLGVIAMSAGNHAQGVAYHAHRLGIPATIVMPLATPSVKVEGTRAHGAEVVLEGDTLEQAAAHALALAEKRGLTFIHPFDDPLVIAGQGTLALEILETNPDLDCLIIPIGGGGLISGIAIAARAMHPQIRILGVQSDHYPTLVRAAAGQPTSPVGGDTLAEGIAVKQPGKLTRTIIDELVDDVLLVDEAGMESAVSLLLNIEKTVVEGAGAAGLAAILGDPERFRGQRIGLVLTGGNIGTRLLAYVLNRELAREGRLARLRVELQDQPGQLAALTRVIAEARANIIEITHQRVFTRLPARRASVLIEVETRGTDHLHDLIAALEKAGFTLQKLEVDEN